MLPNLGWLSCAHACVLLAGLAVIFSLDFSSRNSFVLQGRDHVTVLLLSRQSINSCSLTLPLALMISITSAD